MNVISVFPIVQQAEKTIFVQTNFLRDISLLLLWPQNPFSVLQDEMEMKERRKPELSKNQNTKSNVLWLLIVWSSGNGIRLSNIQAVKDNENAAVWFNGLDAVPWNHIKYTYIVLSYQLMGGRLVCAKSELCQANHVAKKCGNFTVYSDDWGLPKGDVRIFSSNKKCASQLAVDMKLWIPYKNSRSK